jgi:hypothetical protein
MIGIQLSQISRVHHAQKLLSSFFNWSPNIKIQRAVLEINGFAQSCTPPLILSVGRNGTDGFSICCPWFGGTMSSQIELTCHPS